jgi:hypothetical protein
MVWVHPKTAKIISSTTGALVGVGSLKPHTSTMVKSSKFILLLNIINNILCPYYTRVF